MNYEAMALETVKALIHISGLPSNAANNARAIIAQSIREAVDEERRGCADIAKEHTEAVFNHQDTPLATDISRRCAESIKWCIEGRTLSAPGK